MCKKICTYKSNTGSTKHYSNLYGSTPYGNYLLLKEKYKTKDTDYLLAEFYGVKICANKFKQLLFNTNFLFNLLFKHGSLTCVYCGKPNLVIYHWNDNNKKRSNMATADHFNPKDNGGDAFNIDNLVVACYRCNRKKSNKLWSIRSLRYLNFYGNFKEQIKKLVY